MVAENENCVKLLDEWGLQVPEDTINLTARTLPPETIIFGGNKQVAGTTEADFNRAAMRETMLHSVSYAIHRHGDDNKSIHLRYQPNKFRYIDIFGYKLYCKMIPGVQKVPSTLMQIFKKFRHMC